MNSKKNSKGRTSMYVLTAIHPEVARDGRKGHYLKTKNGSFECWSEKIGVFSSIKKAEEAIHELVREKEEENKRWGGWETYFGFVLDEHYLDDALYGEGNISRFESSRTYLSDGELNCESKCDDRCEKKFNGRDEKTKHVKAGDYALVLYSKTLMPVYVGETAMSKEEWRTKLKSGVYGDYTDDSGVVFSVYGHEHPFSPQVFPLSCLPFSILTKDLKKKIEKNKKEYYGE